MASISGPGWPDDSGIGDRWAVDRQGCVCETILRDRFPRSVAQKKTTTTATTTKRHAEKHHAGWRWREHIAGWLVSLSLARIRPYSMRFKRLQGCHTLSYCPTGQSPLQQSIFSRTAAAAAAAAAGSHWRPL